MKEQENTMPGTGESWILIEKKISYHVPCQGEEFLIIILLN